jgi:hypothetical protein
MDTAAVARDYHPFANGKIPEQRRTLGAFCPGYTEAVVSDEEHLQYLEIAISFSLRHGRGGRHGGTGRMPWT